MERLAEGRARLESRSWTPRESRSAGIRVSLDGARRSAYDLLAFPDAKFEVLLDLDSSLADIDDATRRQLERDALYANYIERQERDVEAMARDEAHEIPDDFDFSILQGLSTSFARSSLPRGPRRSLRPGRIEGMTPAALTLILARLRQARRRTA
jgi:tRNA uridine 5-carboxymethylaminomethyl modification enzyme